MCLRLGQEPAGRRRWHLPSPPPKAAGARSDLRGVRMGALDNPFALVRLLLDSHLTSKTLTFCRWSKSGQVMGRNRGSRRNTHPSLVLVWASQLRAALAGHALFWTNFFLMACPSTLAGDFNVIFWLWWQRQSRFSSCN